MELYRLKASEVAIVRARLLAEQKGLCALCGWPITKLPCLDHDHGTGAVRGVLHNGCNALLGKIENNYKRYGVTSLAAFTNGCAGYLGKHAVNITSYLHPTHLTEDEKRVKRNTKARASRAAKKAL